MGWLVLIAMIVAIAIAARSPQGTRVLGRVWVVLSALWIAAVYGLAHKDRLMPWSTGETAEWALIPPAVTLSLFFVLRWIVRGAERRPGD